MGVPIELRNITVTYPSRAGASFDAIENLSAEILPGTVAAVQGLSGSGKSSLLNVIAGIVRPRTGDVLVDGVGLNDLSTDEACDLRRGRIGFVFQAFHLLPHRTALENAALGGIVAGLSRRKAIEQARAAIAEVGLTHREDHRPSELSGGEQQRIAIARALVPNPKLVLADEPTGNLDPAATEVVIAMLLRLRELTGATVVIATHSPVVASCGEQVICLPDPSPLRQPTTNQTPPIASSLNRET